MIKDLRKKFIFISLISIFIVMSIILISLNAIFSYNIQRHTDFILNIISLNNGDFQPEHHRKIEFEVKKNINNQAKKFVKVKKNKTILGLPIGYVSESPFFTYEYNSNGEILNKKLSKNILINMEETDLIFKEALKRNDLSGEVGEYRYLKTINDGNIRITFLDMKRIYDIKRIIQLMSLIILFLSMLATLFISYYFSKKALIPIEQSYIKQKRFITDASHELKTPLAVIDANTEVIEMDYGQSKWTQSTKKQVEKLTKLTNSLVVLARMDESDKVLNTKEFCLSDLMIEEVENYNILAKNKNKIIKYDIQENINYLGEEENIRQVIDILLDNSIKYSLKNSIISLNLVKIGKKIRVTINNKAENLIKNNNYDILFERFYRSDLSRNSETGGYGIGLALAKSIIQLHKGQINAKSIGDDTLEFTIILQS